MAPRSDVPPGLSGGVPELELEVRTSAAPKAKPKWQPVAEVPLELAVEPGALVRERSTSLPPHDPNLRPGLSAPPSDVPVPDLTFDARLLADFGDPPRHWLLSPLYTWRVFKRGRDLKAALSGRRSEAMRAANEVETALVAFAERIRATAEKTATASRAVEELRQAEDLVRSRDQVLGADQDVQDARLSQIDARLANLEVGLAQAQSDARVIVAELSTVQGAVSHDEASISRAEAARREQAAMKERVAEMRARVEAGRAERGSLEHWFKRQVGARTVAVEEARDEVKRLMLAIARRAMRDRDAFGAQFDAPREQIAKLELAADAATRDVMVHEAARKSYDVRSLRRGVVVAVALMLLFVVAPIVWRASRVVVPPITDGASER
ncbi:MAG: hypothetical protein M3O46_15725 [Myxococcota bacterium]|nr:hypothetical protein [Myxococcota bacterium]